MDPYKDEIKLELTERVSITKEVKGLLRKLKRKELKKGHEISMAKIVCNLIIGAYQEDKSDNEPTDGI